jgi:hypothetical protein
VHNHVIFFTIASAGVVSEPDFIRAKERKADNAFPGCGGEQA